MAVAERVEDTEAPWEKESVALLDSETLADAVTCELDGVGEKDTEELKLADTLVVPDKLAVLLVVAEMDAVLLAVEERDCVTDVEDDTDGVSDSDTGGVLEADGEDVIVTLRVIVSLMDIDTVGVMDVVAE